MTLEQEKLKAYQYLTDKEIISESYLEECQKDFENGSVFLYGVPANPEDGKRVAGNLVARISAAIGAHNSQYEIYFFEVLSVILLTLRVPKILGWQISGESKGMPALLLGTIWNKEMRWLPYRIKQIENVRAINPAMIASHILNSPLAEFEEGPLPICERFYKWLLYKAEWQVKKEEQNMSLDEPIPDHSSENEGDALTYRDILSDTEADTKIVSQTDRQIIREQLWLLVEELPLKMRTAVSNWLGGKEMDKTMRRAKDRGIIKLRKMIDERGLHHLKEFLGN